MTVRISLALLLALGASAPILAQAPAAAPAAATAQEDKALLAFLDQAFDQQLALSPESMTSLGLKTDYGKLDDYSERADARSLALQEQQLAELHRRFSPERLGPSARLSYRLFEAQVATSKQQAPFAKYAFPVSTNGSPAGNIPVFLINEHRVDSVADAQAYIARLRDSERVMNEVATKMRDQAAQGIVPPKMVFAPARADAKKVISGAPFDQGPDSTLCLLYTSPSPRDS